MFLGLIFEYLHPIHEVDDGKAISLIKEKFGATYFPKTEPKNDVPNNTNFNTQNKTESEIKITRKQVYET